MGDVKAAGATPPPAYQLPTDAGQAAAVSSFACSISVESHNQVTPVYDTYIQRNAVYQKAVADGKICRNFMGLLFNYSRCRQLNEASEKAFNEMEAAKAAYDQKAKEREIVAKYLDPFCKK